MSGSTTRTASTTKYRGGATTATTALFDVKPPGGIYDGAVAAGTAKGTGDFAKIFKLGIVAGAHIGFGAYLAITVGGACPGIAAENPGLQKMILGNV